MMMDNATMHGIPWLDQPVMLHSSRAYQCKLKSAHLCAYQQGYWRFWWEADHRFALPTTIFFVSIIATFAVLSLLSWCLRSKWVASPLVQRIQAVKRYLSYRTLRIARLNWNTAPLGVLVLGMIGTIFFFAMTLGPRPYYWPNTSAVTFGGSPPIATRSGWMALGCFPFILATASKSNMITAVTGVPHERLQVFHRWIAYAMFILALIHTFPFIIYNISMGTMTKQWSTKMGYWTGVVAILAQSWLTFASFGPLRNIRYEWFKFTHFLAALIFVVFFFLHCDFRLSSWDYFIAAGVIYSLAWLHSQLRTYFTHGLNLHASIEQTTSQTLRISVPTRGTRWRAGQHFFLRFPALGFSQAWSSHPFTACSLPPRAAFFDAQAGELVFYVRPRRGVTAELAKRARDSNSQMRTRVLLDGPYGGVEMRRLVEPKRLLVIVGGSGAGFALPLVESFLRRLEINGDEGASMRVLLATREIETGRWFEEAVGELLSRYDAGKIAALNVEIYRTDSASRVARATGQLLEDVEKAIVVGTSLAGSDSDSDDVKDTPSLFGQFGSRPYLPTIISAEAMMNASMSVFVCGPLSMQHDVASAIAKEQLKCMKEGARDIYLHTEHFSWA